MFDHGAQAAQVLSNARLVTPHGIVEGGVALDGNRIAGLTLARDGRDLDGAYLIPGIVDLHTDHVERHTHPRVGVLWPALPALLAHDAVIISGGTTTVFDSLSVGASMQKQERRDLFEPLVATLREAVAQDLFRAQHLLHLRCEISDPATPGLVDASVNLPETQLVSVMDHTPGDRQSPDIDQWFWHMIRDMEVHEAEGRRLMDELFERSRTHGKAVRKHVTNAAVRANVPLMSHDDRTVAHVDEALAEGCTDLGVSDHVDSGPPCAGRRHGDCRGRPELPAWRITIGQCGRGRTAGRRAGGRSCLRLRSTLAARRGRSRSPRIMPMPYDLPQALALVTQAPARFDRSA